MEGEDPQRTGLGVAETVDGTGRDETTPAPLPLALPALSTPGGATTATTRAGPAAGDLPVVDPQVYEILGVHGQGGLGRILRARDRRTGRVVAIKEIIDDSPGVIARFQREALVTANLQHPAIVPVYEVGRWPSGKPFYAMKLVVGRTLAQAIGDAGPLAGRLALVPHAAQVAAALAYAHDQGWIHRDLKPANVLVGGFGETVVIDWGLARRRPRGAGTSAAPLLPTETSFDAAPIADPGSAASGDGASGDGVETQVGTVVGTPVYMAPEQARGEVVDARADVYAIGALLYHVLGGVAPYRECRTAAEVIAKVATVPPRPLPELVPELAPDLIAIVERAMARDPDARYPTAAELAIDLGRFQAGALVEAHDYTLGERLRRFVARHRAAVVIAAVAVIALIAVSTIALGNVVEARDTARAERGRAEAARAEAERDSSQARRSLAALHGELGRAALAGGAPGRALPHLARALRSMPDDDAGVTRLAIGLAAETLTGARGAIDVRAPAFGIAAGSSVIVPSTMTSPQEVWNLDTGAVTSIDGVLGRLSTDGRLVATRTVDLAAIELAEVRGRAPIGRVAGDGMVFLHGFAGPDRLWAGFEPGTIRRWRITDRAELDGEVRLFGPLRRLDVGGDGRWGVASGRNGEVWRFDLDRGAVTVLAPGPGRDVTHVRVVGDDRVAAFASDGTLRVWRVGGGAPSVGRAIDAATAPAFSRDGTRAAVWSPGAGVRVLDLAELGAGGTSIGRRGAGETVVAFGHDGRLLATGDADGAVAVWSVADGTLVASAPGHADAVTAIGFAGDDDTLISASATGDVRAWRPGGATRQLAIPHAGVVDGAFVGVDRVVTVGGDARGRLTSTAGAAVATLVGHGDTITGVDQTAGLIGTCARDGSARLWKPDGRPGAVFGVPGGVGGCTISIAPAGARVAVARDATVSLYRLDGTFDRDVETRDAALALAWTRDGARWFAVHADAVTLWDGATGDRLGAIDAHAAPYGVIVAPDHPAVAVLTHGFDVVIASPRDGTVAHVVTLDQRIAAQAWARKGTLVVATVGARLDQIDADGRRLRSIRIGELDPTAIAVRPDDALVVIGGRRGDLEVWDRASGKLIARHTVSGEITKLAWSADGKRLLVVSRGGAAVVWDLSPWPGNPDELDRLIQCRAPFALDGERLVAARPPASCAPPPATP